MQLISDNSKVAGYKVDIQKSTDFLYTNYEEMELKIKNTILFTLASQKKIKYLSINLTKYVPENNRTLMNKIIKEINKWRQNTY